MWIFPMKNQEIGWGASIGAQIEHRDEAREIPPNEEPKIEFNLIDLNNE